MKRKTITALGLFALVALLAWPPAGALGQAASSLPDAISGATAHEPIDMPPAEPEPAQAAPGSLERLTAAYRDFVAGVETADGATTVVLADGARLPWDDGVAGKDLEARLASPDLEDMFYCPYPAGAPAQPPAVDADPGRVRVTELFAAVYGGTAKAVKANLVKVPWLPGKGGRPVRFNARNGAADALARVSAELEALPPEFDRYMVRTSGTFNWRPIAGTKRPSAHGFGIAIDINARRADYWRWAPRPGGIVKYKNRIPPEIVAAFERQMFVWGGRWYHYDTMHFEYRPELF